MTALAPAPAPAPGPGPGPAMKAFSLRRVTALIGPYGSGKSELAIGLARQVGSLLARDGKSGQVMLGDLDVLKPYFRSREVACDSELRAAGVSVLAPPGVLANSDLPILTPELRGAVVRTDTHLLLDVGGDPVGARALGSISDAMADADYDLLLVLNRYRPFMDDRARVIEQAHQIVAATHLKVTGIISNTHILDETTTADLRWGLELARDVAAELAIEVRLLGVPEHLATAVTEERDLPPVMVVRRRMLPSFMGGVVLARTAATNLPPGA